MMSNKRFQLNKFASLNNEFLILTYQTTFASDANLNEETLLQEKDFDDVIKITKIFFRFKFLPM